MKAGFSALILLGLPVPAMSTAIPETVDALIEAGFKTHHVDAPAGRCSDADFVRRVYLDFTGRIPEARTASRFITDSDPEKRTRLIDQLLASEEFSRHLAAVFDVMLMERRSDSRVTTPEWRAYLEDSFANGKPLDQLAREILAGGSVEDGLRPAAKFYLDRAIDKDALVRDTGRLFLGMDLQCAQCHDHPTIDDWKHRHYYGLSVFFTGSKLYKRPDGKFVLQEELVPSVEFASVFKPDETNETGPQIPFGRALTVPVFEKGEEYVERDWKKKKLPAILKFSLRELLARELTTEESTAFARNLANRIWGYLMGRGIVHPYDMSHSENPPSHPELLDFLAGQLKEMEFDTRGFLRELALSETYQRSSAAPPGVDPDEIPPESFAIANLRGLSPEQLFSSLLLATRGEVIFQAQIEGALREDREHYEELTTDEEKMAQARASQREQRVAEFVGAFAGTPGTAEIDFQASLPQALFLANHGDLIEWLRPGRGNLAEWLLARDDPRMIAEETYLAILSRPPTGEEIDLTISHLESRDPRERPAAVTELIWALVASAEFRLNH